MLDNFLLLYKN